MNTATEAGNIERHRMAYALFSRHDAAMFDIFTDDIVEHQDPPIVGKAALADFNRAFWTGFSDLRVEIGQTFAAGEYTFLAGRLKGTNDGPMPAFGLDRSGRCLDIGFVEVVRWRNGKAEHSWPIMDHADLAGQLRLG